MKNINCYLEKEVKKIERAAERSARQWSWYQKNYLIVNIGAPILGGIIGGIIAIVAFLLLS